MIAIMQLHWDHCRNLNRYHKQDSKPRRYNGQKVNICSRCSPCDHSRKATSQGLVHINQHFKETARCANGRLRLFWSKKLNVKFSHIYISYEDTH